MKNVVAEYIKKPKGIHFSSNSPEDGLSVDEFNSLFKNSENITKLNFYGCGWLTDAHLGPLILNNIETLEMIDLSLCVQITFKSIQNLSLCKNLIKMNLNNVQLAYNHEQCENLIEFITQIYKNNKKMKGRYPTWTEVMIIRRKFVIENPNEMPTGMVNDIYYW